MAVQESKFFQWVIFIVLFNEKLSKPLYHDKRDFKVEILVTDYEANFPFCCDFRSDLYTQTICLMSCYHVYFRMFLFEICVYLLQINTFQKIHSLY